jgi:hypothetical protein
MDIRTILELVPHPRNTLLRAGLSFIIVSLYPMKDLTYIIMSSICFHNNQNGTSSECQSFTKLLYDNGYELAISCICLLFSIGLIYGNITWKINFMSPYLIAELIQLCHSIFLLVIICIQDSTIKRWLKHITPIPVIQYSTFETTTVGIYIVSLRTMCLYLMYRRCKDIIIIRSNENDDVLPVSIESQRCLQPPPEYASLDLTTSSV